MITESARDYLSGIVFLMFENSEPSPTEIAEYCKTHYGFVPARTELDMPTEFHGYTNPGWVRCYPDRK